MSETKQINARIPVELHDALAAHKEHTGEEKSAVICRGIELAMGMEPAAPPQDVDALVAALAELRRQKRLNLKYLVAALNRELKLGQDACREQEATGSTPAPPAPAPDTSSGDETPVDAPKGTGEGEDGESVDSQASTSDSSTSSEGGKEEHVDLPAWLAKRIDQPRALARLRVVAGHLEINGQRWQEETVPAQLLDGATVTLQGQPV